MNQKNLPQLYSLTAMGIATFLGSALAAGYMLAKNYSALGQPQMGRYALIGSIVLVLVFIALPGLFTPNMTTAVVFMISQVVLVLFATNRLQGAMFRSFEEMGGKYYSVGKGVMVGVVASFIITAAWIFLVLLFGPQVGELNVPPNS
jgi:hypothetical protein